MGSKNELLTFGELQEYSKQQMNWKDCELVATVIDPRLCLDSQVMMMDMWKKAIELFKKGYIDFYVTMKAFDRAKALEKIKK